MTKSSEVYTCVGSGTFQNYTQVFSRERSKNKLYFHSVLKSWKLSLGYISKFSFTSLPFFFPFSIAHPTAASRYWREDSVCHTWGGSASMSEYRTCLHVGHLDSEVRACKQERLGTQRTACAGRGCLSPGGGPQTNTSQARCSVPRWLPQLAVINPQQSIILLVLLKEHQSSHPGLDLMDLSGGFFLLGMIILPRSTPTIPCPTGCTTWLRWP